MRNKVKTQKQDILDILAKKPSTVTELAVMSRLSTDTIRNRLRELKSDEQVHVSGWKPSGFTQVKIYSSGKGRDVPKLSYEELRKTQLIPAVDCCAQSANKNKTIYRRDFFDNFWLEVITRSKSC